MKNEATARRLLRGKENRQLERPVAKSFPPDLSGLPILGSETALSRPLLQSGALAFRRLEGSEIAVLLVKKPHSASWGIPKGNAEPHLTLAENAAKEAFEEAGVRGRIDPRAAGTYRSIKRKYGLKLVVEVCVYLLEVIETAAKWPEKGQREIKWCSPHEAAALCHQPLLAELCGRLVTSAAQRERFFSTDVG